MKRLRREDLTLLERHIASASRITITAHAHPDGDALGSTVGLLSFLRSRRGCSDCMIVLPDKIAPSLNFVTRGYGRDILTPQMHPGEVSERIRTSDLIFCLDCAGFSRTEGLEGMFKASGAKKILIDHHLGPQKEDFCLVFSETEISSASELLFYILTEMEDGAPLPYNTGRALMCGMTTDTNNFANSVFPTTLDMASALLQQGIDRDSIVQKAFNTYRVRRLRLLGHLLDSKLVIVGNGAYMIMTKEEERRFDIREGETEGFVNIPLSAGRIKMSVFLKETDDAHFRVSVRSKKGWSANAFARRYFHGGGHENASGGKLFFPGDIPGPQDAAAYVEKAMIEFLKK